MDFFVTRSRKVFIKSALGLALRSILPSSCPLSSSEDEYIFFSKSVPLDIKSLLEEFLRSFSDKKIEFRKIVRPLDNCLEWFKSQSLDMLVSDFALEENCLMYGLEIGDWIEFFYNDFCISEVCLKHVIVDVDQFFCSVREMNCYRVKYIFTNSLQSYKKLLKLRSKYESALLKNKEFTGRFFSLLSDQTVLFNWGANFHFSIEKYFSTKLREKGFVRVFNNSSLLDIPKNDFDICFEQNNSFQDLFSCFIKIGKISFDYGFNLACLLIFSFIQDLGVAFFVSLKCVSFKKADKAIDILKSVFGEKQVVIEEDIGCENIEVEIFLVDIFENIYNISSIRLSDNSIIFVPCKNCFNLLDCLSISLNFLPLKISHEHVRIIVVDNDVVDDANNLLSYLSGLCINVGIDLQINKSVSFRIKMCADEKISYAIVYGRKDSLNDFGVKSLVCGSEFRFSSVGLANFLLYKIY